MGLKKINVCGFEIEVLSINGPTGKLAPLVFMHEGLGSVAMWRDWPETLCRATGRSGWVYSRRGYGTSSAIPDVRSPPSLVNGDRSGRHTPDYLHHEAWTVLPTLLENLDIQAPVLIGHSDGASIALLHASRFPVTACIAMAPHVMVEDMTVQAIEKARQDFVSGQLRSRLTRYHSDVDCAFWQWNDIWLDPAFRKFDIRSDCRNITAPVLALQGLDDPYGSLRQMVEIIPVGQIERVEIDSCGHSPQRDQPAQTIQNIKRFLQSLPDHRA